MSLVHPTIHLMPIIDLILEAIHPSDHPSFTHKNTNIGMPSCSTGEWTWWRRRRRNTKSYFQDRWASVFSTWILQWIELDCGCKAASPPPSRGVNDGDWLYIDNGLVPVSTTNSVPCIFCGLPLPIWKFPLDSQRYSVGHRLRLNGYRK